MPEAHAHGHRPQWHAVGVNMEEWMCRNQERPADESKQAYSGSVEQECLHAYDCSVVTQSSSQKRAYSHRPLLWLEFVEHKHWLTGHQKQCHEKFDILQYETRSSYRKLAPKISIFRSETHVTRTCLVAKTVENQNELE